ncbi:MAG: hypothetical protein H0U31_10315 [Chloroflexia bacterium]|nr:hypothetical protein [Chloroflexia bacterium]
MAEDGRSKLRSPTKTVGVNHFAIRSKERGAEIEPMSDDNLIELMVEEPTLLRRPMVIGDGGVVLGHNPRQLEKLIAANQTDGSTQA